MTGKNRRWLKFTWILRRLHYTFYACVYTIGTEVLHWEREGKEEKNWFPLSYLYRTHSSGVPKIGKNANNDWRCKLSYQVHLSSVWEAHSKKYLSSFFQGTQNFAQRPHKHTGIQSNHKLCAQSKHVNVECRTNTNQISITFAKIVPWRTLIKFLKSWNQKNCFDIKQRNDYLHLIAVLSDNTIRHKAFG